MKAAIIGIGMIPVREYWSRGLRELAAEAGKKALDDAGLGMVDAVYIGNAYGGTYNQQTQLGCLIAEAMGLAGVEAYCCEAGDASGGVALRTAVLAVGSGQVGSALVVGVEKATDVVGPERVAARGVSLDADYEAMHGATLTAMAGLQMRRYMLEYGLGLAQFEGFSVNAHRNGAVNGYAMYRNRLREGAFVNAPMVAEPVSLFDSAPDGDGAAAVVLVDSESAADLVPRPIEILGSAVATDSMTLQEREEPLRLDAVGRSFSLALGQAGIGRGDIDLMELHDAYTILPALSLEAMGYSEGGAGWRWAEGGGKAIALDGALPISTFGGLKSRGNPSGAAGVYQAVEAGLQLRGAAGDNQVDGARYALIQNMGGLGSTVATHILGGSRLD